MTCCHNIKQSQAKQFYVQSTVGPFVCLHAGEQTCFNAEGKLQSVVSGGHMLYLSFCMQAYLV
jgi:hypothetical protein